MAVAALGRKGLRCRTKNLRLHGAPAGRRVEPKAGGAGANLRPDPADPETARATHLAGRYGTEAPAVLALADGPTRVARATGGRAPLSGRVEALWAVRSEMAGSVSDVLDRRTQSSLPRCPGRGDRAPSGSPPSSVPSSVGTPTGCRSRPRRTPPRVRAELARAGLDPDGSGAGRSVAARRSAPATRRRQAVREPAHAGHRDRRRGRPTSPTGWAAPGWPIDDDLARRLGRRLRLSVRCSTTTGPRPVGTGGRWPSAGPPPALSRRGPRWWPVPPTPPRSRPCWPSATPPGCR